MLRKIIYSMPIIILTIGAASAQTDPAGFLRSDGEPSLRGRNLEKKSDGAIDRAYQSKQIDKDYKAATSKVPDQKPNDPWGAIRPAPSTLNPKTPTPVAGARKKQQ